MKTMHHNTELLPAIAKGAVAGYGFTPFQTSTIHFIIISNAIDLLLFLY